MNSSNTWLLTNTWSLKDHSCRRSPPSPEPVVRSLIRPGDESVEGHGHVENGCAHGVSFPGQPQQRPPPQRDSALHRWAGVDSNHRATDYESAALTAELP